MNPHKTMFTRFILLEFIVVFAYFSLDMPDYFAVFAVTAVVFAIFLLATFVFEDKEEEQILFSGVPLI